MSLLNLSVLMNIAMTIPILVVGAVSDWRKRTIPNAVPIALLVTGVVQMFVKEYFFISVSERMLGFFIPFGILFFIYMINPKLSGGGDLKLISSLGFCVGLQTLIYILVPACIGGIIHCLVKKENYIPMGFYIMLGTVVIITLKIILGGI